MAVGRSVSGPLHAARAAARRSLIDWLARVWKQTRMLYQVLLLVRFSFLLGIAGALVMLLNDQAQDVLRVLGEDVGWPALWFLLAAVLGAAIAWWSARVMFYFRFRNPASAPHVFPWVKEQLPRALGASVLVLTAIALFQVSLSYDGWITGPAGRLRLLVLAFLLLAAGFVYATVKRRQWFARLAGGARPSDLRALSELHWQAWLPLVLAAAVGFGLMVLFAYRSVEAAPLLGTATVALCAVVGLIPVGTFLVYLGNRASLPVVSLALIWAVLCTYLVDNHYVRLHAGMDSYDPPEQAAPPPGAQPDIGDYLGQWAAGLAPAPDGAVPVLIVAAEGGGIRAAYWTALVLGELQDRATAAGLDFARHVLAISGVSGGSLGAATFAALVGSQKAGHPPKPPDSCPVDENVDPTTLRGRAERVLRHDFLSPAVAVMLFSDNLQQVVPYGFLNDRAVPLERSFEAAWDACEDGSWFHRPFGALWAEAPPFAVPALYLNSTVVETGQRLIAAPVRIGEPAFSEALSSQEILGPELPLSTAVHNSARFTYVSPAGTVRWDEKAGTKWLRLVDGGYFENSGAVTAGEVVRNVRDAAGPMELVPVVIHISNDPATTAPDDLAEKRKWLNQVVAPVKALLNTRPARGFQAREDLAKRVGAHLHFRLCRNPDGREAQIREQPLPLGWALSSLARAEMRRQLGVGPDSSDDDPIVRRNRASMDRVLALLRGETTPPARDDVWECPRPAEPAAAS
jgi:hypothetical protein